MSCEPNDRGPERIDILSLGRAELADQLAAWSIARGHAATVWRALHRDGVVELADIAGLPPAAQTVLLSRGPYRAIVRASRNGCRRRPNA